MSRTTQNWLRFPNWGGRFTPVLVLCVFLLDGLFEASQLLKWEVESCQVKHQCQSCVHNNQIIISQKVIGFSQKSVGAPLRLSLRVGRRYERPEKGLLSFQMTSCWWRSGARAEGQGIVSHQKYKSASFFFQWSDFSNFFSHKYLMTHSVFRFVSSNPSLCSADCCQIFRTSFIGLCIAVG